MRLFPVGDVDVFTCIAGYVEFGEFRSERAGVKKVGTFAGVFCPVVLSMFSALVFIRMGNYDFKQPYIEIVSE